MIVQNGLVAYYNSKQGYTTNKLANLASTGTKYDGTIINPNNVTVTANGLTLSGNQAIVIPMFTEFASNPSCTIEFRANITNATTQPDIISDSLGSDGTVTNYDIYPTSDGSSIQTQVGTVSNVLTSGVDTYVSLVLDNTAKTLTTYVNGVQINQLTGVSKTFLFNTNEPYFLITDTAYSASGLVDNIRIYNRVLTSAEVQQNYNVGTAVGLQANNYTPDIPTNLSADINVPVTFSGTVNDQDGGQAQLTVDYSTDQTFTTGVTTITSNSVNVGTTASVSTNSFNSNTVYYWRARTFDGVNYSSYSSVMSFTSPTLHPPTMSSFSPSSQTRTVTSGINLSATINSVTTNNVYAKFDISQSSTFASGVTTLTSSTVAPNSNVSVSTGTLAVGVWYWRVKGYDSTGLSSPYSSTYVLYVDGDVTERIKPDAIIENTGYTGTISAIQDDVNSPDGNWLTPANTVSSSILRVSFSNPQSPPKTNGSPMQTIRIYVKSTLSGTSPTFSAYLYENGVNKQTLITGSVVSSTTGQIIDASYYSTSTLLSDATGNGVELRIVTTPAKSGKNYGDVAIGAITFVMLESYTAPTVPDPSDTVPPANVTSLAETHTDITASLTWTNPSDSDFSKANVYRNNVLIGNSTNGSYTDSGLTASTIYTYKITSVDTSNNESTGSTISVTTNASQQQSVAVPSIPTNLFPFNNSAWTKLHFEADVTDADSISLTFYVDYSTDSTLATGVTTLSVPVTLPSIGATARASITSANTITESTVYYWRAYAKDESNNQSSYTSIFNFTAKFASGDNMVADGVQFMQQGDPNKHGVIVDINSANDSTVNFTTMLGQGVKGCYMRCYGHDHTTIDANFIAWVGQAKTMGMPTGGYFYAMPSSPTLNLTDAHSQADTFISGLQQAYGTGQYGDLMPMLDIEDNTGYASSGQTTLDMTVADLLTWCNEFRNYFEQQTGRTLGVYVNNYFVYNQRNNFNYDSINKVSVAGTSGNIIKDMPLWVAGFDYYARYMGQVMPECGGWLKWYAFQHTDKGTASTYGITASNSQADLSWCEPIEYLEPPKATTGVSATNNGNNISLTWNTTIEVDVHQWDIYVDGTKVGSSNIDGSYTISNVQTGTHTIEVRPVDDFGDDPITTANTISYTISSNVPNVNITSVTHYTLSDETGFMSTDVTFTFDEDVTLWTVNVLGSSYDTGTVASSGGSSGTSPTTVSVASTMLVSNLAIKTVGDTANGTSGTTITAGTPITATIDWTKLYQEGQNKVNIYGKNTGGTWTPYQA